MAFFTLKCPVLYGEFLYYAKREIETLNREYLQSIAVVRIRLTASALLPCVHSWLEYLSVKK